MHIPETHCNKYECKSNVPFENMENLVDPAMVCLSFGWNILMVFSESSYCLTISKQTSEISEFFFLISHI
jgi:hypothetical protein